MKNMSSFRIWWQLERQQENTGKVNGTEKKQLVENFATNLVKWQQVCNMNGYKKSTLERQQRGRSSPNLQKSTNCGTVLEQDFEHPIIFGK